MTGATVSSVLSRSARKAANKIARLRERDGDDCWICGGVIDFTLPRSSRSTEYPLSATFDHVTQKIDGGARADDNIRLAHKCCNHWMMSRDLSRPQGGIGLVFGPEKVGPAKARVRRSLLNLPPPRHVPFTERDGGQAMTDWLAAYDRALADITARHEQHKADIKRTSDRLDRVANLLGKVGAV